MVAISHQDVRQFLEDTWDLDVSDLANSDGLFSSGLLDSLSITHLIVYIESKLNSRLDVAQLSLDELDTVDSIVELACRFEGG